MTNSFDMCHSEEFSREELQYETLDNFAKPTRECLEEIKTLESFAIQDGKVVIHAAI